jgi:hypothetical protein
MKEEEEEEAENAPAPPSAADASFKLPALPPLQKSQNATTERLQGGVTSENEDFDEGLLVVEDEEVAADPVGSSQLISEPADLSSAPEVPEDAETMDPDHVFL